MIQDLSHSSFKFLSKEEVNNINLDSIAENSLIGFILEVDLEYCKELHDLHSNYPLCYDVLSKCCKDIADWYDITPSLGDKVKYVVHYENLKYYLPLRMKLIKIHRILSFKQSNWLKKYVDFNTKKRQESIDEFNKSLYKLLNNSIYGKSIENQRKRRNVKLINDKKTYLKCVNKQNFVPSKILDKNFVTVHCSKTILTLNKPIYVDFCILELSKLLMCQFHYDYVLKTFNNVKLLFTDTGSLVYETKNSNVYDQCFKDKDLFDFSGYPKDSIY